MSENNSNLKARVAELERRVAELESLANSGGLSEDTPEMRSFVEATSPETHIERSVTIGHFLERFGTLDSFTTADITSGYETCRVPQPANMSDVLLRAENQGLIMPVESEGPGKAWRVSADGERFVDNLRSEN